MYITDLRERSVRVDPASPPSLKPRTLRNACQVLCSATTQKPSLLVHPEAHPPWQIAAAARPKAQNEGTWTKPATEKIRTVFSPTNSRVHHNTDSGRDITQGQKQICHAVPYSRHAPQSSVEWNPARCTPTVLHNPCHGVCFSLQLTAKTDSLKL